MSPRLCVPSGEELGNLTVGSAAAKVFVDKRLLAVYGENMPWHEPMTNEPHKRGEQPTYGGLL
jgi:hypothetical protein